MCFQMNDRDASHFKRRAPHLLKSWLLVATVRRAIEERHGRTTFKRSIDALERLAYYGAERWFPNGHHDTKRGYLKQTAPSRTPLKLSNKTIVCCGCTIT